MTQNSEQKFIAYALNLARKNLGQTAPNPVVACVIVKNGEILASGVTAPGGRPHAEKIAIDKVADKKILQGAELYVTLEPCSHFGATPPCTDEIIKAGFKKVVIATRDIDARVNGQGIQKLREAGIDVVCGVLEKEAQEINRGFFKARQSNLPFVTLKLATSLDGKIASKNFDSKWITSEKSRLFAHHLRAVNDAILVGANTVKYDDPSLDCRILGLEDSSPKKVILTNNSDLDLQAKIFQNHEKFPTIILSNKTLEKFPQAILCAEKNGRVDLPDALQKLCALGVNALLVEGGQQVATQFLKENLVDELIWIRNAKIIGNDGIPAIGDLGAVKLSEALNVFTKTETRNYSEDSIEIYRRF